MTPSPSPPPSRPVWTYKRFDIEEHKARAGWSTPRVTPRRSLIRRIGSELFALVVGLTLIFTVWLLWSMTGTGH